MTPLTEKDIEYQRALAAMHSFAIEDIQTNRGGWMTEAQISKLRWRPVIGCFGLLLLVGGLLIVGAILSGAGVKNYFYKLDNGRKFKVSKAAYNALDCTRPYCVYYSPLSHRMLAVEVLPDTGTAQRVPTFTQFS